MIDIRRIKIYYNTFFKKLFNKFILVSKMIKIQFLILGIEKKLRFLRYEI